VHAQLLDYLENVDLFTKFALRTFEEEVITLFLRPEAAATLLIEAPQAPKALVLV